MVSETLTCRILGLEDLDAVVELDRLSGGISRHGFIRKRLDNQMRHPDAFISMVATTDDALAGFVFCHMIEGEFGGTEKMAILDALGVDPNQQGHRVGHQMLDNLITEVRERGGRELRTQVGWNQRGVVDFFCSTGFSLAPRMVLECGPHAHVSMLQPADELEESQGLQEPAAEIDFSDSSGDDLDALSRDKIPVRSLQADDIDVVIRIDRKITGQDRGIFYRRKFSEVLEESGVRISLVAELDEQVVGFIMARVDYGEFGRTDTVAVIDNIAIAPSASGQHVGLALMDQLLSNLRTLRVQTARTEVDWNQFDLSRFLERCGFYPSPHLALSQRFD